MTYKQTSGLEELPASIFILDQEWYKYMRHALEQGWPTGDWINYNDVICKQLFTLKLYLNDEEVDLTKFGKTNRIDWFAV